MNNNEVINTGTVDTLKTLMKDRFSVLIETFLDNATNHLIDFNAAVSNNATDDVISISHALKGSSASVGATSMYELCKAYEDKARQGDFDDLINWVPRLEIEFKLFKEEIEAHL